MFQLWLFSSQNVDIQDYYYKPDPPSTMLVPKTSKKRLNNKPIIKCTSDQLFITERCREPSVIVIIRSWRSIKRDAVTAPISTGLTSSMAPFRSTLEPLAPLRTLPSPRLISQMMIWGWRLMISEDDNLWGWWSHGRWSLRMKDDDTWGWRALPKKFWSSEFQTEPFAPCSSIKSNCVAVAIIWLNQYYDKIIEFQATKRPLLMQTYLSKVKTV